MNSRLVTFVVAVLCEVVAFSCEVAALVVLADVSDPNFALLLSSAICFFISLVLAEAWFLGDRRWILIILHVLGFSFAVIFLFFCMLDNEGTVLALTSIALLAALLALLVVVYDYVILVMSLEKPAGERTPLVPQV